MPHTFKSIALVGNAKDSRVAECMLSLAAHFNTRGVHAMADPGIAPVFAAFDDVTIKISPGSWTQWDMAVLDAQAFGGRLGGTPGYMLPLD